MDTFLRLLNALILAVVARLPQWMVYPFARMYIAGTTRESAIQLAHILWHVKGIKSTIDFLGEDPRDWSEVGVYENEYRLLCIECHGLEEFIYLSCKPSGLGLRLGGEECFRISKSLLELARAHDLFVRWDMEDSETTSATLWHHLRLRKSAFFNQGVVLQSRLLRTELDLTELAELSTPEHPVSIRLCIGIYPEASDIALQDKESMKSTLLGLLKKGWRLGLDIRVASHDPRVVRMALQIAQEIGKPLQDVEIQMLYGVPDQGLHQEILAVGANLRLYIPYGQNWYAYCMRRFKNNPDLVGYILKNFFLKLWSLLPWRRPSSN